MARTILVVEDEVAIQTLLKRELEFENYQVELASTGPEALEIFRQMHQQLDLILLDWMIPEIDGLGVLRRIRKVDARLPIIFLTARDFSGDKVAGLNSGADDYITKPFDIEELLARIRVIFRHQDQLNEAPTNYQLGNLTLDTKAHQVAYNGDVMQLTQREYSLLLAFMQHANQTMTRDEILDDVWGTDFVGQTNIVDVYVRQLRQKLHALSASNVQIQSVRGIGYVLKEELQDDK
ncbi:response regulator transcription factor [Secundilactobacillus folii]|uniref:Response regulator n=1 Tax=Secundilactobacillus folii TaxID=2678357 RepID=A0A7X2XWV3_9LACO|nr:response regulator transcription factor [Secundilactobacillus folii]MTV83079.1 response regulator [Secundilactobacillus folii]